MLVLIKCHKITVVESSKKNQRRKFCPLKKIKSPVETMKNGMNKKPKYIGSG